MDTTTLAKWRAWFSRVGYVQKSHPGHKGVWGQHGGSAPRSAGLTADEPAEVNPKLAALGKRGGASPLSGVEHADVYANKEVLAAIRPGDKVKFGSKGSRYVQGWKNNYFYVTKIASKRFVEGESEWNLVGAIHFSDATDITSPAE